MQKEKAAKSCLFLNNQLLLDDLQDLHGASLDTDAAGQALGGRTLLGQNHNLHGAGLNALTAADALLLVDHVNTGLGVLSDGFMLAGTHALAALDTDVGLGSASLLNNLDAAEGHVVHLIKSLGTSLDTLQASHAFCALLNSELLHKRTLLYLLFIYISIIHVYR